MKRIILHSLDRAFRLISIDPDLPDPDKHSVGYVHHRPILPRGSAYSAAFSDVPPPTHVTHRTEAFVVKKITHSDSLDSFRYWERLGSEEAP